MFTIDHILKLYAPTEVYCPDCRQFHKTHKQVSGNTDFPIALCDQCEENWDEFLSEYGILVTN